MVSVAVKSWHNVHYSDVQKHRTVCYDIVLELDYSLNYSCRIWILKFLFNKKYPALSLASLVFYSTLLEVIPWRPQSINCHILEQSGDTRGKTIGTKTVLMAFSILCAISQKTAYRVHGIYAVAGEGGRWREGQGWSNPFIRRSHRICRASS